MLDNSASYVTARGLYLLLYFSESRPNPKLSGGREKLSLNHRDGLNADHIQLTEMHAIQTKNAIAGMKV